MFSGCSLLKKLNISNFKTENVVNMSCMFHECSSLKELKISHLNTKNVTNFNCMFSRCSNDLKMKILLENKNIKEEAFSDSY